MAAAAAASSPSLSRPGLCGEGLSVPGISLPPPRVWGPAALPSAGRAPPVAPGRLGRVWAARVGVRLSAAGGCAGGGWWCLRGGTCRTRVGGGEAGGSRAVGRPPLLSVTLPRFPVQSFD